MKSRPCRARALQEGQIKERGKGLKHAPFFISSLVLGTWSVLVIGLLRAQTVLWDSSCSQGLGACCSSNEPSRGLSIACAESWILPYRRLLAVPAGTANACMLIVFIWKQGKWGLKVFLYLMYALGSILALPSTADFIHSWHSNVIKTSVVKMSLYTLCLLLFSQALSDVVTWKKKKATAKPTNWEFVTAWTKMFSIYHLALQSCATDWSSGCFHFWRQKNTSGKNWTQVECCSLLLIFSQNKIKLLFWLISPRKWKFWPFFINYPKKQI